MTNLNSNVYDVVILGGGLAGLTLSLQLKQAFADLMPRLRDLYHRDRTERRPMVRRVRFGMYGYVAAADAQTAATGTQSKGAKP